MREYQERAPASDAHQAALLLSRTVAAAEYIINRGKAVRAWYRQTE